MNALLLLVQFLLTIVTVHSYPSNNNKSWQSSSGGNYGLFGGRDADATMMTCMKGTVTLDADGQVLHDNSKSVKCESWATQCYTQTVDMQHSDFQVQTITGGCWNPMYRPYIDTYEKEMNEYLTDGSYAMSFEFESCDEADCNTLSPEESVETIDCYSGLKVVKNEFFKDMTVFSSSEVTKCKSSQFCETVTTQQTVQDTQEKYTYTYTGCGDDADTTFKGYNVLPYVPPSTNEVQRMKACAQLNFDCTEFNIGLCICKDEFPQEYATISEFIKVKCETPLCNKVAGEADDDKKWSFNWDSSKTAGGDWKNIDWSQQDWSNKDFPADFNFNFDFGQRKMEGTPDLTCMKGTIMRDMATDEVLYDDIYIKKCNAQWATECSKQTMQLQYGDDKQVEMTTGLCWNSQFNDIFQAFESEKDNWIDSDATILGSTQEHCQGSNCFDISSEAEETLQCYYGLTVTDANSGKDLFVNKKVIQCKIHEYCETNIIKQTVTDSSQKLIYKLSDCGDPNSIKYKGLNIVPYIPDELDDVSRMRKCAEYDYGCTENYLGLCVCKKGMDVSKIATMSERVTQKCDEALCNE